MGKESRRMNKAVGPQQLFIGPQAEQRESLSRFLQQLLQLVAERREQRFPEDPQWGIGSDSVAAEADSAICLALERLLGLLRREIPTFSPRYLGHMVSDISIPALLGHLAMLFENANLASREAALVASQLETEAINLLADMVGFAPEPVRGHFTSGGTLANFEAVWRARYRQDHWLALGIWLRAHGHSEASLFELAHCGWDFYEDKMTRHGLVDADLAPYSGVLHGGVKVAEQIAASLHDRWPEPVIIVPGNKHYSWPKAANVFGMGVESVWACELDALGRLDPVSLIKLLDKAQRDRRPVMMVVTVAGTTELGMIDPVDQVADILDDRMRHQGLHFWHHIDAAYGGYFCSTLGGHDCVLSDTSRAAFRAFSRASSVTLDPHKLGFVPYACGAFLVPDARSYRVSTIHAPYLENTQDAPFPSWSTTLEGSRAATGASAVWLSAQVLPLTPEGHGAYLNASLGITRELQATIAEVSPVIRLLPCGDTNLICFSVAEAGETLGQANTRTERVISYFRDSPELSVTRTHLGVASYRRLIVSVVDNWGGTIDVDQMTVVRMVVMNPYLESADIKVRIAATLQNCIREAIA